MSNNRAEKLRTYCKSLQERYKSLTYGAYYPATISLRDLLPEDEVSIGVRMMWEEDNSPTICSEEAAQDVVSGLNLFDIVDARIREALKGTVKEYEKQILELERDCDALADKYKIERDDFWVNVIVNNKADYIIEKLGVAAIGKKSTGVTLTIDGKKLELKPGSLEGSSLDVFKMLIEQHFVKVDED